MFIVLNKKLLEYVSTRSDGTKIEFNVGDIVKVDNGTIINNNKDLSNHRFLFMEIGNDKKPVLFLCSSNRYKGDKKVSLKNNSQYVSKGKWSINVNKTIIPGDVDKDTIGHIKCDVAYPLLNMNVVNANVDRVKRDGFIQEVETKYNAIKMLESINLNESLDDQEDDETIATFYNENDLYNIVINLGLEDYSDLPMGEVLIYDSNTLIDYYSLYVDENNILIFYNESSDVEIDLNKNEYIKTETNQDLDLFDFMYNTYALNV